jgi:hypothetical protein
LEQAGAQQALRDAGEDQDEVAGAEGARDVGGVVGDGVMAERVGELPAVVDELGTRLCSRPERLGGDRSAVVAAAGMNEKRTRSGGECQG